MNRGWTGGGDTDRAVHKREGDEIVVKISEEIARLLRGRKCQIWWKHVSQLQSLKVPSLWQPLSQRDLSYSNLSTPSETNIIHMEDEKEKLQWVIKERKAFKLSDHGRQITEPMQLVMLLQRGYEERVCQRDAERKWEKTGPILRGHTMFGLLSLNPGRLSRLIMVDKPLYRTCSCHRH